MERDFNRDDFENFLKQKSNQHRVNPSEKTWKNIYNTLHPTTKWFKIGGGLLILSGMFLLSHNMINKNTDKKPLQTKLSHKSVPGRTQNTNRSAPAAINDAGNTVAKNTITKNTVTESFPVKSITSENTSTQLKAELPVSDNAPTGNSASVYLQPPSLLPDNHTLSTEDAVTNLNTTSAERIGSIYRYEDWQD